MSAFPATALRASSHRGRLAVVRIAGALGAALVALLFGEVIE